MLETDDGLRIGEAVAICRFIEDEHPEPNLMGLNGREKASIEMWERRAYDEGMTGAAEVFRNAHPAFINRGLQGSLDRCRRLARAGLPFSQPTRPRRTEPNRDSRGMPLLRIRRLPQCPRL
jgi:glutathione S-transferase